MSTVDMTNIKLTIEGVHSLMAVEKLNHQSTDWFPLTLAFTVYLVSMS